MLFAVREYEKKTGYTMDLLPDYAGALTPDITVAADNNVDEQGFVMRVEKTGITVLYRAVWAKKNKLTGWVGFWCFSTDKLPNCTIIKRVM